MRSKFSLFLAVVMLVIAISLFVSGANALFGVIYLGMALFNGYAAFNKLPGT